MQQRDQTVSGCQVGYKSNPFRFLFPEKGSAAQVHEGKQGGSHKDFQNVRCPVTDAKQRHQLDVAASDTFICNHGDEKQEHPAAEKTEDCGENNKCVRQKRFLQDGKRDIKKTPGKERKQGSIADLVVFVIVQGKEKQRQNRKQPVKKQCFTHACCTSHHTDCPESVRRHLS